MRGWTIKRGSTLAPVQTRSRSIGKPPTAAAIDGLYRAVVETVTDAIIVIDDGGIMLSVNGAAERLFGYAADKLVGRNLNMLMPQPYSSEHDGYLDSYERSGVKKIIGIGREVTGLRRDGSVFPMELSVGEVQQGGPRLFVGIVRDISERKHAELLRLHLAAIVESSNDAIIGETLDGIVTSWNSGAEEIFGYAADEMLGRSTVALLPPNLVDEERKIIEKVSRGDKVSHGEAVRCRKDGAQINVSLTVSPIRDADGRIIGASMIARDLTKTERNLAELQATLANEWRLSEMGQIGSALAHELNQPLSAIGNYIEAGRICVGRQDPAKAIENLRKAAAQVNSAGEIIQRFRQFAQKGTTERRRESINTVIEEASALALMVAPRHGIRTTFDLAPSAPRAIVDKVQIEQVVVNLIRNSIEAMAGADPRRLTIVTALIAEAFVEVSVSDTGCGLRDEVMAKLFQPFISTKPDGMGIGLSLSRSIILAHGGDLRAEQNPERGATFRFTLPLGD